MSVQIRADERNAWMSFIPGFDAAARQFATEYAQLRSLAPYVRVRQPSLAPQYDALIARGAQIEARIAHTRPIRDAVAGAIGGAVAGQAAVGGALYNAGAAAARNYGGLGFLEPGDFLGAAPIVGVVLIASVTGVLALIANWIKEAQRLKTILNETRRLEETGLSPQEASNIARGASSAASDGGVLGGVLGDVKWLLIGAAALFFLPTILREWKR